MTQNTFPQDEIGNDVMEAAAAWTLRLGQPNADEQAFTTWLARDPSHQIAFDRASRAYTSLDDMAGTAAARAALDGVLAKAHDERRRRIARRTRLTWAAAGVAIVLGAACWPFFDGLDVYRTGVGERRVITLSDGSRVELDALTTVEVRYTPDTRKLRLVKGQAQFDVAHNAARPFSVTARDRVVIATGTAFNIDILAPKVSVTLIEGRVEIVPLMSGGRLARGATSALKAPGPVVLASGEQFVAEQGAPERIERVSLGEATAWQTGKLIFEDEPLASAAERMNRYSERKLMVDDAALGLRISGVFNTGDVSDFVEAVTTYLPISAEELNANLIALRKS